MRTRILTAALVVAMTAVSCVNEQMAEVPQDNSVTFEATFDASATKALLKPGADKSSVEWELGDQVSILVDEGNYLYEAQSAGATTTLTTEETDVPSEGAYYALHPYDVDAVLAEGKVTTALPAEQTAVLNSFTTHLAVAASENTSLKFKNVCGLVKVNVSADNVTRIVFEGNNAEVVSGAINITVSDTPSWEVVAEEGLTSVTLVPAEGTEIAQGDYYFAVLPQTFSAGFKVTAYKGDNASVIRNVTTEVTVARAGMIAGKSFGINGSGTEEDPYILKTPQDMVDMRSLATYGGETWFRMANDIDMKNVTDYVPVNWDDPIADDGLTYERKIHFDGGNNTLSNFTCNDDNSGYPSLFGVLYGSCKNLNVVNAAISSEGWSAGVLGGYVGTTDKPATVTNVSVQGTVTSKADRNGGMAGNVVGSTFTDCTVDVTISSSNTDLAGFAGKVLGESSFTRCDVKAVVTSSATAKNRTGAFAGWVSGTTVTFTECNVLSGSRVNDDSGNTAAYLGMYSGFVAYAGSSVKTIIDQCSVDINMNLPMVQNAAGLVAVMASSDLDIKSSSVKGTVTGNNQVAGLVAYVESGNNLTITDSHVTAAITGTGHYTAGVVGNAVPGESLTLKGTYVTGDVKSSGSSIAGLVGAITKGTITLENCYVTGNVTGNNNVGGLAGNCAVNGTVKNCYYKEGKVSGNGTTAGLFGVARVSLVEDCYVEADIAGKANGVGGLFGNTATNTMTMTRCHYSGTMTTAGNAGGLFGRCEKAPVISKCYAEGTLTANGNYSNIGGLLGYPTGATLSDCFSTMDVTSAGQAIGGIIGTAASPVNMTRCFSTGDVQGRASTGGLVGMSYNNADGNVFENSIFWGTVTNTKTNATQYGSGAIVGCVHTKTATGQNCWRGANVTLTDYTGVYTDDITYENLLVDHEDFVESLPPYIEGIPSTATNAYAQRPYHGKAAGQDETLSDVALRIGWDTTVWDLSGDLPKLK